MTATLQSILDSGLDDYRQQHRLSAEQQRACGHIRQCRTEALGEVTDHCDQCPHEQTHYLSCRDRHCPQCQYQAIEQWQQRQSRQLIPVTYYHLVFTLPHELNGWIQLHPDLLYGLLFKITWQTLNTFAHDPRRLNGQAGMSAVLHTWAQNLTRHVHLHCLVPGGVVDDSGHFKAARGKHLFPVRALSRVFRGKFVSALRQCYQQGQLHRVTHTGEVDEVLNRLMAKDWVVYARNCMGQTQTIVEYLSRYTRRIAISDQRIVSVTKDKVTFTVRDNQHDGQKKLTSLSKSEFIRRFLQHVLPKGFMRVRHYGFLANAVREKRLQAIRKDIQADDTKGEAEREAVQPLSACRCPKCKIGHLIRTIRLPRPRLEGG